MSYADMPYPGDSLPYLGKNEYLTNGQYYEIIDVTYEIVTAYQILVRNDNGRKEWYNLVDFNWSD